MTPIPLNDATLGAEIAVLWQRHRQTNLDRIALVEVATANVLRSVDDGAALDDARGAAHKLAGSLGTFGFDAGSRAALEAESLLRQPVIDGRLLAEAVTQLRTSIEEGGGSEAPGTDRSGGDDSALDTTARVLVVSADPDLIGRLSVEAAAIGVTITASVEMPSPESTATGSPAVIVDDQPGRSWSRSMMMRSIAELARSTTVILLTDRDEFEDRVAFARAGVAHVLPRSQGARQTMALLAEERAARTSERSTVLALSGDARLTAAVNRAGAGLDCHVEIYDVESRLWDALESHGADLVLLGPAGTDLRAADLCRVIRAHPRWQRLPIIVLGARDPDAMTDALSAGAADYLSARVSSRELGERLHHHLEQSRLEVARSDVDPLTGTRNRAASERALDHQLRLSSARKEPFTLALIALDQADQLRAAQGSAVCDVVVRRLGAILAERFPGRDVVGRSDGDGFSVGMVGVERDRAGEWIAQVMDAFSAERFATTSGTPAQYTFSAGLASSPADAPTLPSLQRLAASALLRAQGGMNTVMGAGEHAVEHAPNIYDVVLVEDDDSVADVIEFALRLRHYQFIRFSDGAEAARALGERQVKAQVVLLDIGLPSLDGFGILQVLRSQGVLSETRVIMLTARSSEAEMLRALGLGATEHIAKPFSIPVLLGRLDQTRIRSVA